MTEQEQIEEMTEEIEKAKQHIWASVRTQAEDEDYLWHSRAIAEHLTSQGYQKIDLFAECRNCTAWSGTDCTRHPYTQGCLKDENNIKRQAVKRFENNIKSVLEIEKKQAVKEFAAFLISQMGGREYMGVKYKQGVFSENDIYEMVNEFLGEEK